MGWVGCGLAASGGSDSDICGYVALHDSSSWRRFGAAAKTFIASTSTFYQIHTARRNQPRQVVASGRGGVQWAFRESFRGVGVWRSLRTFP